MRGTGNLTAFSSAWLPLADLALGFLHVSQIYLT
jgi:hypothetical protein